MITCEQLVEHFQLLPHPEGGFFAETYRSKESINQSALPERFSGSRSFSTSIYFLLDQGNFSAFHRIKSDECWHFYAGQTLLIYILNAEAILTIVRLGSNIAAGEVYQYVVTAGCWFASEPAPQSLFSFVGCTVAPGFDFADFELADADTLYNQFPQHVNLIKRLCR